MTSFTVCSRNNLVRNYLLLTFFFQWKSARQKFCNSRQCLRLTWMEILRMATVRRERCLPKTLIKASLARRRKLLMSVCCLWMRRKAPALSGLTPLAILKSQSHLASRGTRLVLARVHVRERKWSSPSRTARRSSRLLLALSSWLTNHCNSDKTYWTKISL
jgi:hypothetical protein